MSDVVRVFQHVPAKPDQRSRDLVGSGAEIAVGKDGAAAVQGSEGKAEVVHSQTHWHYRQYIAKERR